MAKELPDLELFNMYNLVKDKPLWIGGQNDYESIRDKIVFNFKNGSFCLAFAFGQDRINSIFYTAYGSNAGDIKVQHGWWAWILIDK
ncbi:hypothetical protein [Spiroplasma endosymbiont of Phyllotreta cruciferae]|uniref:hypothetical protein n=1 Tax=Spiroplasma endosymbiont of Phyllotreta cruciferae TaxID=2886375 RepID=UPI00209D5764|nr:hypothetical protein [Spiroplasma endosymbiont of Phyllotreta cruciferae]